MRVIDTNASYAEAPGECDGELSIDELARRITSFMSAPTLDEINRLFSLLLPRQRDYERFRVFADRKYARNLVARGEFAELLLLCWKSGQRTPIHDHGGSIGVVLVCEGLLTETMYERTPEGRVRPFDTHKLGPGSVTGADVPDIHQLLNLQPGARELVTLHCYAPPLSVLNTFSPNSSRVGRWREGCFSGGAGI